MCSFIARWGEPVLVACARPRHARQGGYRGKGKEDPQLRGPRCQRHAERAGDTRATEFGRLLGPLVGTREIHTRGTSLLDQAGCVRVILARDGGHIGSTCGDTAQRLFYIFFSFFFFLFCFLFFFIFRFQI